MTDRRWQLQVRELVRQFQENGMKMLLEHPANVRDLLRIVHAPWLGEIDFRHVEQIKTTFVRRDYRQLESEIVLTNMPNCRKRLSDPCRKQNFVRR